MSARGLVPIALAVAFGIANGYVTFNPAFQELEVEKMRKQQDIAGADLGPDMIEVPTPKPEGQREEKKTDVMGKPSPNALNSTPLKSEKSRWWLF